VLKILEQKISHRDFDFVESFDAEEGLIWQVSSSREFNELTLLLQSRAIPFHFEELNGGFDIYIPNNYSRRAKNEYIQYQAENKIAYEEVFSEAGKNDIMSLIFGVMLIVAFLCQGRGLSVENGAADAFMIVHGEILRSFTALLLHADAFHLLGNLVFGYFIFRFLFSFLGFGIPLFLFVLLGGVR